MLRLKLEHICAYMIYIYNMKWFCNVLHFASSEVIFNFCFTPPQHKGKNNILWDDVYNG